MTAMPLAIGGLPISTLGDGESDRFKILAHGPQGSGKSTLLSTLAALGPQLYIDMTGERGLRSFEGAPYSSNIRFIRPTTIAQLDDVYWELEKGTHPFESVVIDSVTSVQKLTMRFLLGHSETAVKEIKRGASPASWATWGQSLDIMSDVANFWFSLASSDRLKPIHVGMVAQSVHKGDEESGEKWIQPDVQKGALGAYLAAPDYVVYCDFETSLGAGPDDPKGHIVRFGGDPYYRTKARVPIDLRGKIPTILGREGPLDLVQLGRVLRVGGIPRRNAIAAPAPVAAAV